jgi:uncharacterized protein (TIGR02186 family)
LRRARAAAGLAGLGLVVVGAVGAAQGPPLVADLSDHLIAISAGFTGTNVVMFGATDGVGDVVMMVRGPASEVIVWRKERIAGIWVNRAEMAFAAVPSYYAVAASRNIDDFADPAVRVRHEIGPAACWYRRGSRRAGDPGVPRGAIAQAAGGLYAEVGKISFLGQNLFRTEIHFPANVPTGSYLVEVLLIREGEVVGAQTTPLIISKIGLGAEIFDFAHANSAVYGVVAILGALLAGWIAHLLFRRK